MDNKKNYTITEVKEDADPEQEAQNRLAEDPLDHLPDDSKKADHIKKKVLILKKF